MKLAELPLCDGLKTWAEHLGIPAWGETRAERLNQQPTYVCTIYITYIYIYRIYYTNIIKHISLYIYILILHSIALKGILLDYTILEKI